MSPRAWPLLVAGALFASSSGGAAPPPDVDPRVARLLDEVSEERLAALLRGLEGFQTRHTLSSAATPDRGIAAARQWILEELQRASPRLQVSFDTYQVPPQ